MTNKKKKGGSKKKGSAKKKAQAQAKAPVKAQQQEQKNAGAPMEDLSEVIRSNPYDVKLLAKFEEHVSQQVTSGGYDFDANRHLLKLYTLDPNSTKCDLLAKVLVMALMRLPNCDFTACTCLINEKLHDDEHIRGVMKLAVLLETAQFAKFWKEASEGKNKELLAGVAGFEGAIRTFICSVLERSYQDIPATAASALLRASQAETDTLVQARGWTKDGKVFRLPTTSDNQFAEVDTTEKIPYDEMYKMLNYAKMAA